MIAAFPDFPLSSPRATARITLADSVDCSTPDSDHELMLSVRDGDLDALGKLFERHHSRLFGYLYKLTGQRAPAEDIVQTVFQRMLKYRHTYRNEGSFTAWMYHLARKCAADQHRKSAALPLDANPGALSRQADEAPGAAESAAAIDDRALLRTALDRLDPADREVLLLSRIRELSFAEVAEVLECSAGAARVRAHRALGALRDHFFKLQKGALP